MHVVSQYQILAACHMGLTESYYEKTGCQALSLSMRVRFASAEAAEGGATQQTAISFANE